MIKNNHPSHTHTETGRSWWNKAEDSLLVSVDYCGLPWTCSHNRNPNIPANSSMAPQLSRLVSSDNLRADGRDSLEATKNTHATSANPTSAADRSTSPSLGYRRLSQNYVFGCATLRAKASISRLRRIPPPLGWLWRVCSGWGPRNEIQADTEFQLRKYQVTTESAVEFSSEGLL